MYDTRKFYARVHEDGVAIGVAVKHGCKKIFLMKIYNIRQVSATRIHSRV